MRFKISHFLAFCLIVGQTSAALSTDFNQTHLCNEETVSVGANDSPNKKYFEQVLENRSNVSLSDLMVLWYPEHEHKLVQHFGIESCQEQTLCDVDTVYSWGSLAKLETLKATLRDRSKWQGEPNPGRMLSTLFSAVGSYAYGPIPVRLKLKPSAAHVNPRGEHTIRDGSEIESWSFGAPEHYDEIVRDYLRYKSGNIWYGYALTRALTNTNRDQLFFDAPLDGHAFREEALKSSMMQMVETILRGEGRIYYADGACRNQKLAFATKYPSYINPHIQDQKFSETIPQSEFANAAK